MARDTTEFTWRKAALRRKQAEAAMPIWPLLTAKWAHPPLPVVNPSLPDDGLFLAVNTTARFFTR